MVLGSGRNLTNRFRSLLGLPATDVPGQAPDREASTVVSDRRDPDDGGYRLPDFLLERYQVKGVLGRGAFGIVYLAKDARIGRLIAIKQLYRRHSSNRAILSRFIQEARIAGQLEHPNIVTIFDVTGNSGAPCIVMEYLGGGNLATVLRNEGTLVPYRALTCIRGVVSGLDAAHRLRVIHRDVKPANILFDRRGNPKLGDFGVAHLPLEAGGLVQESEESPAGTPDFMAPEQADTSLPTDGRADLFSTGALLLRMLTGERIYNFGRCTDFESMSEVILGAKASEQAEDYLSGAKEEVRNLVVGFLAHHPDDRPANAAAALKLIDNAIAAIRPPSSWQTGRDYGPASSTDLFSDLLRLFLVDGIVTPPERHELDLRAARLGVSTQEARRLEEDIRSEMSLPQLKDLENYEEQASAWMTAGGDPAAHDELDELARSLNISPSEQQLIEGEIRAQRELDQS
jgi:serine/threonine protein kinase